MPKFIFIAYVSKLDSELPPHDHVLGDIISLVSEVFNLSCLRSVNT